jgi:hypothetical protein
MFKKTKLFVGISLLVQAASAIVMFIFLIAKKKSIAGAFLALAALSGAAGGYRLCDCKKDEELSFGCLDCEEDYDCCDCGCCCDEEIEDILVEEEIPAEA